MSSRVHEGCTRVTRRAVRSHRVDANLCIFAGTRTTEDHLAQRRFLPYKQEVGGSSPSPPTWKCPAQWLVLWFCGGAKYLGRASLSTQDHRRALVALRLVSATPECEHCCSSQATQQRPHRQPRVAPPFRSRCLVAGASASVPLESGTVGLASARSPKRRSAPWRRCCSCSSMSSVSVSTIERTVGGGAKAARVLDGPAATSVCPGNGSVSWWPTPAALSAHADYLGDEREPTSVRRVWWTSSNSNELSLGRYCRFP
jgi:hypothetical protein